MNYNLKLLEGLRDDPFVTAPQWPYVQDLLRDTSIYQLYLPRENQFQRDALHELFNIHRHWVSDFVDTSEFEYAYTSAGVTDAINQWLATETREWQYLTGDYQWPARVSNNGICVDVEDLDPDRVLYFSNPQCATGNWASQQLLDHIDAVGCPVVYDAAYIGSTALKRVRLPIQTEQIWFGFSKGFGLVGQRCGIVYSKNFHNSLHPMQNVGCYDYSRIHIMHSIIQHSNLTHAWDTLHHQQLSIANNLNATPSDTVMLVNSTHEFFADRVRHGSARVCITPLLTDVTAHQDP